MSLNFLQQNLHLIIYIKWRHTLKKGPYYPLPMGKGHRCELTTFFIHYSTLSGISKTYSDHRAIVTTKGEILHSHSRTQLSSTVNLNLANKHEVRRYILIYRLPTVKLWPGRLNKIRMAALTFQYGVTQHNQQFDRSPRRLSTDFVTSRVLRTSSTLRPV